MPRSLFTVLTLAAVALVAAPALAADEGSVADALVRDGYYLEGVSDAETGSVRTVASSFDDDGPYLVVLQDEVGDPSLFAEDVLELLPASTVLVLTPELIGTASDFYDDDQLDRAIDASLDAFDVDYGDGLQAFAEGLPAVGTGAVDSAAEDSGGFPTGLVVTAVVVAGGVGFLVWRNKRQREDESEEQLDEAQAEVEQQVAAVANDILELSDRVTVSDDDELDEMFRAAGAIFSAVEEALPGAADVAEVERLGEQLDEARWQLDAVEARLDGRVPPPKPVDRPARCFFDPTHRAGTEEAIIKTSAGDKTVSVCKACEAKLQRGEKVAPRTINVGGRPVPAPRAPKSYGGSGFDWMDVFSVVVGGSNVAYDMRRSGSRTSRPSPRRTRTTPRRTSSVPRTRSVKRTRSGKSASGRVGRATRSRSRSKGRSSRRR